MVSCWFVTIFSQKTAWFSWNLWKPRTGCSGFDVEKQQSSTGWWYTYPSEKYESQLGLLFPIYGKIKKNVPNHQQSIRCFDIKLYCLKQETCWWGWCHHQRSTGTVDFRHLLVPCVSMCTQSFRLGHSGTISPTSAQDCHTGPYPSIEFYWLVER